MYRSERFGQLLLAAALAMACSTPLLAASEQSYARVTIVPALEIAQLSEIDFGQLNNVNGACAMSSSGTLSGDEGLDCVGSETPASFRITGLDGTIINLSVSGGSLPGISFTPAIDGASQRSLAGGYTDVTIIGSLSLNDTEDGEKSISYLISANYE